MIPKSTVACITCRLSKKKCSGKLPCSNCEKKHINCQYADKRKRGPKKHEENKQIVVSPSPTESGMLDIMEAKNLLNIYVKYINSVVPMTTEDKLLNPASIPQKVQSYSALAYISRLCGDHSKSVQYISQARLLSGSIYDSITSDSVVALSLMSNYWQLTFDMPLSNYFSTMAKSLCRMIPSGQVDSIVQFFCEVNSILRDVNMKNKQKIELMKTYCVTLTEQKIKNQPSSQYATFSSAFLSFIIHLIDANINHIHHLEREVASKTSIFTLFNTVIVSEEKRLEILQKMHEINEVMSEFKDVETTKHLNNNIMIPLVMGLVEWKSNHPHEALNYVLTCLSLFSILESSAMFPWDCHFVDYGFVVMLGGLCQFLYEIGYYSLAIQMCLRINSICKILSPELDFVYTHVEAFLSQLPPIDAPAISLNNSQQNDILDQIPLNTDFLIEELGDIDEQFSNLVDLPTEVLE